MVHLLQCSHAHLPLPIFFSILLLFFSMEVAPSDARRLPLKLLEVGNIKEEPDGSTRGEKMKMEGRNLIGSRPPRCERVCMSCGHCEAVQVPIVPQQLKRSETKAGEAAAVVVSATAINAAVFTYRVNGLSNYKPLSWKCKCGGIILDP
ncbi:EPIDERMAL PATTERNING FACTOR-like protein 2 [Oryza brachyantha]|uniref:Epidermal patterning factor-like protein n=1 Tax=Oryza brachyantha TaxID=4533 RepID=J3MIE3_ORYBR|nr:EPIDERMAL PATTERNING FACTOR-like protein 2 [Oryza brachyantha]